MRLVFCGSPEFAVPFFEALQLSEQHTVVGVITQPDRPASRGLAMKPPAIKEAALRYNLPILQPEKINAFESIEWIKKTGAEILVVVAYGEFLGKEILNLFKTPPINVHPSLLPDLRGAAPVQWAILNGQKKTGVSVQFMSPQMDAGDIILQESVEIEANETSEDLFRKVTPLGIHLLLEALNQIASGKAKPTPQNRAAVTFAPLLKKSDGAILWGQWTAEKCHNRIRGLFPWPASYTQYKGKRIKILRSYIPSGAPWGVTARPGEFLQNGDEILVRCQDGPLAVQLLQPEGKRPMLPREFVNGIQTGQACYSFDTVEAP